MTEPVSYASVSTGQARNKAAVWAMVLGIVGLVLSPVVVGGVLGVVALIVGIVGITRPGKKGAAVTGIVTGACALPVALLAVFFWVGFGMAVAVVPRARVHATEAMLAAMKTGLDRFEVDNGRYPSTAEGTNALLLCPASLAGTWRGPYPGGSFRDSWGHAFIYRGPDVTGTGTFALLSVGPDGVERTGDDVVLPKGP